MRALPSPTSAAASAFSAALWMLARSPPIAWQCARAGPEAGRRGLDALAVDRGVKRPWLKVFETAPVQMLNAYGEAKYARFGNPDLWRNMTKPLKSGAEYLTVFASSEAERRGAAANRWLHAQDAERVDHEAGAV